MQERHQGTVNWFSAVKGSGFIGREDGEDVFVHFSALNLDVYRKLIEGQQVEFNLETSDRGLHAVDVVGI